MPNDRARANDDARPPEPVTTWENDAAKGHALCAEVFFDEHIQHTKALRERQAAYLDSLPTDPRAAISAALELMHPNTDPYPEGIEDALHLSFALEALIQVGQLHSEGRDKDAAIYIAEKIGTSMHRAVRQLDKISDILSKCA